MKYKKQYTQKEWNKFNRIVHKNIDGVDYYLDVQEIMCKKYDIIITDYMTKREKTIKILKKFNVDNLNRGIDSFNKGVNKFTTALDGKR
jgi:hypothetical protein